MKPRKCPRDKNAIEKFASKKQRKPIKHPEQKKKKKHSLVGIRGEQLMFCGKYLRTLGQSDEILGPGFSSVG